ncbi:hypothetical protein H8356DRAFT_1616577 [Neocallimastix lanati (nom. inval.)]|nr:hypothetical protein H8356DRAFT_1616577 [Neocallimastix sp. JGI-2020a]
MNSINELATSIQKILNSPTIIHSYNIVSKFIDITSTLIDKITEILNKIIKKYGNSKLFSYKMHFESKFLFSGIPWPKVVLIICLTFFFIKIIQTAFSWIYRSVKFMMKSFIISVSLSIIICWLIENSTQRRLIQKK